MTGLGTFWCSVLSSCLYRLGSTEQESGLLTVGDVDDSLNFDFYLKFKDRTTRDYLPNPDLSDRVVVRVHDSAQDHFSCAVVEASSGGVRGELQTGTDGTLSIYPHLDGLSQGSLDVQARVYGGECPGDCSPVAMNVTLGGTVSLQLPAIAEVPTKLDLAFVIDTTGSMGDELHYIQAEILSILGRVRSNMTSSINIRVALVLYRDVGDDYVVSTTPFDFFEGDSTPALKALADAAYGGGGDFPEAMDKALQEAVELDWRRGNVARVIFLVADAPPHKQQMQGTFKSALAARAKGVHVYGLAGSGVEDSAEYLMRLMSLVTGARYLWLTDDSGIGNAHAEPKVQCYQVTRLDSLIIRILQSELQGSRIEAEKSEVIREVGRQEGGVCLIDFTTTAPSSASSPVTSEASCASLPEGRLLICLPAILKVVVTLFG